MPEERFPLIVRRGVNQLGRAITYYLNYSAQARRCPCSGGVELLSEAPLAPGDTLELPAWGTAIVEGY